MTRSTRGGRGGRGFTLVELLVVIGVIAVLIGILVPVLGGAREQAKRTVCANQMRQLTTACVIYLGQHKRYPALPPLPAGGGVYPSGLDVELVNAIGEVLRLPPVTNAMSVDDLPQIFVPPQRHEVDLLKGSDASFGRPIWNAGFSYHGSSGATPNTGKILLPNRTPDVRGKRRGVLWSDHCLYVDTGSSLSGYGYFHFKGSHSVELPLGTIKDATSLRGIHRGWSDGAVEWVNAVDLHVAPATVAQKASYSWQLPTGWTIYHWY